MKSLSKPKWLIFLMAIFATLALAASQDESCNPLDNPDVQYRPWARWWWPGGDVDDAELAREVKLLADMGFGGVEIQAFTMGLDPKAGDDEMARRMSYDSPEFYRHLAVVMDAAKEANIGVDLNLGSGWPSGGEHIAVDHALKTLLWSEKIVHGPGTRHLRLKGPDKPIAYRIMSVAEKFMGTPIMDWRGGEAELIEVVAGKVTGGRRSLNPVNFHDQLMLDPDSIVVLTDAVTDGKLAWDVPSGKWAVIAIYSAPEGEHPTLAAADPPGLVVDHFSADAARYNLDHLLGDRTGLPKYYGTPLRAFFNDSFEFKTERHFTPDFLAEFQTRRGYDLRPLLPAALIPGGDDFFLDFLGRRLAAYSLGELDSRVQYDYSLTVSDLFIERYLDTSSAWAAGRGLQSRAQGYGINIDVIRAQGHIDIPETEQLYAGGSSMFLKFASAGACLYNRPIVSSESMVWSGRDYLTTPLKIKAAADKLFAAGVNHVIYHGYSYKKDGPEYGETGWYPWSSPFSPAGFSSNISEANPYWKYIKQVNLYIARCQYILRQNMPSYDLLVYYPFLGVPSSFSGVAGHDEELFTGRFGDEPDVAGDAIEGLADLVPGEPLPDPRNEWLAAAWPRLMDLEARGYTWTWVNDESLAESTANGKTLDIRGNKFKAVVLLDAPGMQAPAAEKLAAFAESGGAVAIEGPAPARVPGLGLAGADQKVRDAFGRINSMKISELGPRGILPALRFTSPVHGVSQLRQVSDDGDVLAFFSNTTSLPMTFEIDRGRFGRVSWLAPWTMEQGKTARITLPPYGSLFWMGEVAEDDDSEDSSPSISKAPLDLTRIESEGEAPVYRAQVTLDKSSAARFALSSDWVSGAGEVWVNGREAGALLAPADVVDITSFVIDGINTIEVRIIPPLRNHLIEQSARRDKRYKQFRKKPPLPPDPDPLGPVLLEKSSF